MKRFLLPLFLFLSACSTTPTRQVPPVIDGHTGETEPTVTPEVLPQPVDVPTPPVSTSRGAVVALLEQADGYRRTGDSGNEAATIERALRIDPRNAVLWSRLAAVRLEQGRPGQAEQLAMKSNTLAQQDKTLQARNWRLVARARWALNDSKGARLAEQRAHDLGG